MNILVAVIRLRIAMLHLELQKGPQKLDTDVYEKKKKNGKSKMEFKKVWFKGNFQEIMSENEEVFIELDFDGMGPDEAYRECRAGLKRKDPRCEQFFEFINKIYVAQMVPKDLVFPDI
jgi:hypothetical protein